MEEYRTPIYTNFDQYCLRLPALGASYLFIGMSDSIMVVESGTKAGSEFAEPEAWIPIDPGYIWQCDTLLARGIDCRYQGKA